MMTLDERALWMSVYVARSRNDARAPNRSSNKSSRECRDFANEAVEYLRTAESRL